MEEAFSLARLNTLLQAARALRIGVIGDLRLAARWLSDASQNALSSGRIVSEAYIPAGAANAACQLAALGIAQVRVFSVLGQDWRAGLLRQMLGDAGVDLSGVLLDPSWVTPFFAQIGSESAQEARGRLTFLNTADLSLDAEEQLLAHLESALPDLDALVVADGLPEGVITPGVLEGLTEMAAGAGRTIFTVSSGERTGQFTNMVRVSDHLQAARWLFPRREPGSVGLREFAEAALYPHVDCGCPLFITLLDQGTLVLEGGESHLAAAPGIDPLDGMEAREIFLAVLTAALAAGASSLEAAHLGHLAATVTAQKDTGEVAAPEEIQAAYGTSFLAGR